MITGIGKRMGCNGSQVDQPSFVGKEASGIHDTTFLILQAAPSLEAPLLIGVNWQRHIGERMGCNGSQVDQPSFVCKEASGSHDTNFLIPPAASSFEAPLLIGVNWQRHHGVRRGHPQGSLCIIGTGIGERMGCNGSQI